MTDTVLPLLDFQHKSELRIVFRGHAEGIVVASIIGHHREGSEGNPDDDYIYGHLQAACMIFAPAGLIIDASQLTYSWGDGFHSFVNETFEDRPARFVYGPGCDEAVLSLMLGGKQGATLDDLWFAHGKLSAAIGELSESLALSRAVRSIRCARKSAICFPDEAGLYPTSEPDMDLPNYLATLAEEFEDDIGQLRRAARLHQLDRRTVSARVHASIVNARNAWLAKPRSGGRVIAWASDDDRFHAVGF